MSQSLTPSRVSLPDNSRGCTTVLDYLALRFPAITHHTWRQRMQQGKVHWSNGGLITPETPYRARQKVCYYREVPHEPLIPVTEQILFHNDHLLVAHKPHFLPVMPGGVYVNECLQNRLIKRTGIREMHALHRLDRDTAGLVMFAINPASRAQYHQLFTERRISKQYQAIAHISADQLLKDRQWEVKNRLQTGSPSIIMQITEGEANSHSKIRCIAQQDSRALFELEPVSGKMHQLRLHMMSLNMPIENDRFYPTLQPKQADNHDKPLQLLAKRLTFTDPLSGSTQCFESPVSLQLN